MLPEQKSRHEARTGIAALRGGRKDEAGLNFFRALTHLDDVPDQAARRNLLSEISEFFLDAGFEDLGLLAVLEALELDKQLGLQRGLVKDSITYANIHLSLENMEQAETIYRALIDTCVRQADYANAASASTNLAGILANNQYLAEARGLLENSLEYLTHEEFPATELNTRFALMQVLELQQADPALVFDHARTLLDRFAADLRPQHYEVLASSVASALARHAQARPEVDAATWKQQHFPEL